MAPESLQDVVESTDDLVEKFRETDISQGDVHWTVYEDERTHWIEEQRASHETCILMDQSYHIATHYFEGPDAVALNADLGVSNFDEFPKREAPQAKQHPICNPKGYIIGDPILFLLGDEKVSVTGNRGLAQKWLQYNAETGDYDASVTDVYTPYGERPPVEFRFEIQGPNARAVMGDVLDGSVPEISFFEMDVVSIHGHDVYMLGHGMASSRGYEIFGPFELHDEIKERILEVGADYGIRELGAKAYKTGTLTTGWLPLGLPAIYEHDEMEGYRRWLDADSVEANWSLGGSFDSANIEDYYLNAVELGYEKFINFDREFVGRDALRARAADPDRTKVTFVWDEADVVDIFASLFRDGETYKIFEFPDIAQKWDMGHFDEVRLGGELVGVSLFAGYDYNQREMLSLGVVDVEHSDPGTEATLVWGEEHSEKARVERHVEKDIGVTIAPAPYASEREDM